MQLCLKRSLIGFFMELYKLKRLSCYWLFYHLTKYMKQMKSEQFRIKVVEIS